MELSAEAVLNDRSIAKIAPILRSLQRNSIRLYPIATSREPKVGDSKLGGRPDLPRAIEWPMLQFQIPPRRPEFQAAEGRLLATPHKSGFQAMPFLGQLRCEDLAPFDIEKLLPQSGMLSFFFFDEWYKVEVPPDFEPKTGGGTHDLVNGFTTSLVGPDWHSRVRVLYSEKTDSLTRREFPPNLPLQNSSTEYRRCSISFGTRNDSSAG